MSNRRFDWHEHIKDIEGEYRAARIAVDRFKVQLAETPDLFKKDDGTRVYIRDTDRNIGRFKKPAHKNPTAYFFFLSSG